MPINYWMQWHKGKKTQPPCPIFESCCWWNRVHNSAGLEQTFKKTILPCPDVSTEWQIPWSGCQGGKQGNTRMYLFTLLSLTILCLLHFLPMQYACACAGIVAVNNPEAYNKSPCRAIDVPFKAARSVHCKYKIFITRLHTHSACPPLGQLAASPAACWYVCSVSIQPYPFLWLHRHPLQAFTISAASQAMHNTQGTCRAWQKIHLTFCNLIETFLYKLTAHFRNSSAFSAFSSANCQLSVCLSVCACRCLSVYVLTESFKNQVCWKLNFTNCFHTEDFRQLPGQN